MKTLMIVRHAKSSWKIPLEDKDRPLELRGINDAHLVSQKIAPMLPRTFMIYSSTARRAKKTAIIFAQNISYPTENIIFTDELYTFDIKQFEHFVRNSLGNYDNVIVFGHNAAITNFVNKFAHVNIDNVPTSGFVSMQFDVDNWNAIETATVSAMVFPKQLRNLTKDVKQ